MLFFHQFFLNKWQLCVANSKAEIVAMRLLSHSTSQNSTKDTFVILLVILVKYISTKATFQYFLLQSTNPDCHYLYLD